ncbi:Tim44/TimA family putative adaptor protein [Chelatococcus reniformis]|uniref:Calcium-binding protein n=1 Tax=Chelatococcus reniformis TaxID=1494448 RepID=A0A916X8H6_9HYPH|nr:Tim44/TimA family putative adaptor protein [Chelatococcus reniformis]GGC51671.1 calcium-binding protein [Chelatococcus reniformis]
MQDSFDLTTIIFLALAVFVIWRLRSVLGQRTGSERPPTDPFARREPPLPKPEQAAGDRRDDNVVQLPGTSTAPAMEMAPEERWKGVAEPGSPVAAGLDSIVAQEPSFDGSGFVQGAKAAYEAIVTAFAAGDRRTLKGLLSREVFDGFEGAIAEREKRGERAETTFVSVDNAEVTGVEVKARNAQVTVRFTSKLITVTRNASGAVVDGSPDTVVDVTDVWTFARTLGAKDPNWQLVATESGQ